LAIWLSAAATLNAHGKRAEKDQEEIENMEKDAVKRHSQTICLQHINLSKGKILSVLLEIS